jgi:hypothetical protein
MAANPYRSSINDLARDVRMNRGLVFGVIIVAALMAFEIFNYSTTDFALTDLLGDLQFAGLRWATILAIAFCGIDFAGIARLLTPENGQGHNENWFLFGAWLLAATMNAMLTWWGVSLAIINHQATGDQVIARETMIHVGPVFVAILVWLIRVLIIGTFSAAGDRLFNVNSGAKIAQTSRPQAVPHQTSRLNDAAPHQSAPARPRPSRPLSNGQTLSERPSIPRRTTRLDPIPEEPEYEDDENYGSYPDTNYSRSPLAAKPNNSRPISSSPSSQEGGTYRIPIPPRRKS